MKRAISIFMLLIMSLTAVHTTWAFHYCGGSLHSAGIAGNKAEASCCGEDMQAESYATSLSLQNVLQPESCCSSHLVEMSTDDFQTSQQDFTAGAIDYTLSPVLFIVNSVFGLSESGNSPIQHIFPPGGLAKYSVNLLTLICIFRI